jgi:hypothetical protein
MRIAALLLLLAACSQEGVLDPEIRVVRSDVRMLENEVPPESPIWIEDFNKVMDDATPDVPETVYRHVVRKLWKMSDAEIGAQIKSGVKTRMLREEPSKYRGQFVRAGGRVARVWPEEVNFGGFPSRRVYAGIMYVNDIEPVLFHVLTPPEMLYVKEDMIGFDGIFLKVVCYELSNGGTLRAPLLVARSIHKLH